MNRVTLVGRLTKDPDFSLTPSGIEKATFTLAVGRTFSNAQGEKETDFIYCVVWRKQAVNVNNYLKKGNLAGVDGRIQTRSYEGQDGKKIYVTEVIAESVQFLESKGEKPQIDHNRQAIQNANKTYQKIDANEIDPFANMGGKIDITEDVLPF